MYAELVAVRILHDDAVDVIRAGVDTSRTERYEPLDLRLLVVSMT
jgi:hypothetical protein